MLLKRSPIGVVGSLPTRAVELILGKSEVNAQGLMEILSVLDTDYLGEIGVLMQRKGIQLFILRMKIAHLLLSYTFLSLKKMRRKIRFSRPHIRTSGGPAHYGFLLYPHF